MDDIFQKIFIGSIFNDIFNECGDIKVNLDDIVRKSEQKQCDNKVRSWQVNPSFKYFDFFKEHKKEKEFSNKKWKQKYGRYEPSEIETFHMKIKDNYLKKQDTFIKSRNKLLLYINFLHTAGNLYELTNLWKCGVNIIKTYVIDTVAAILLTYKNEPCIISVPNHENQKYMSEILKITDDNLIQAVFYLDNTHKLCLGRNDPEKRSWKFHWRAAWSHLFVIDRIFGLIIAINSGNPARKHDLTTLRESEFGINFNEYMSDIHYCLGDSAYLYFKKQNFAPLPKRSSFIYKLLDKDFRKKHRDCRVKVENFFSHYFINQNIRLNKWPFKGKKSLSFLNCVMITSIIVWNQIKLWNMNNIFK